MISQINMNRSKCAVYTDLLHWVKLIFKKLQNYLI